MPEDELGRLVIRDHPDLDGPAVYLEALPDEVTALGKANVPMVTVEWQPPGGGEHKSFTVPVPDFDKLAKSGPTSKLLDGAPRASGRRSSGSEEINYATLEHAGRPHRGRISPEEAGVCPRQPRRGERAFARRGQAAHRPVQQGTQGAVRPLAAAFPSPALIWR